MLLSQATRKEADAQMSDKETKKKRVRNVSGSNKMWGGRFSEGPNVIMREINASISFDKVLWRQDLDASKAHINMLSRQGVVSKPDAKTIINGLNDIALEYENGVPEDKT